MKPIRQKIELPAVPESRISTQLITGTIALSLGIGSAVLYQNAPKGFALKGGDVRRDRASGQSGVCCC
jgi:hypothetical protein